MLVILNFIWLLLYNYQLFVDVNEILNANIRLTAIFITILTFWHTYQGNFEYFLVSSNASIWINIIY